MCKFSCLFCKLLLSLQCEIKKLIINHLKFTVMKDINKTLEAIQKQIEVINQFSEFDIQLKLEENGHKSEYTYLVTPVVYGMFSQVVINILIDVSHRFGLHYFVSYDSLKNKPAFVMYSTYDYTPDID